MNQDFKLIHQEFSQAGKQLTAIGAAEASAGNLSFFTRELFNIPDSFSCNYEIKLPVHAPFLVNGWLIITASGARLRDIQDSYQSTLCIVKIHPYGESGTLITANPIMPSSEWNSHLVIHNDQVGRRKTNQHAIVHAQPIHLTYISHLEDYSSFYSLNQRILRWQPETILVFPEGIGTIPFSVPGSVQLMQSTLEGLRNFKLLIWQKHGVIARSDLRLSQAVDLVEYAETAAKYEVLNLLSSIPSPGLTTEELRAICQSRDLYSPFLSQTTD